MFFTVGVYWLRLSLSLDLLKSVVSKSRVASAVNSRGGAVVAALGKRLPLFMAVLGIKVKQIMNSSL